MLQTIYLLIPNERGMETMCKPEITKENYEQATFEDWAAILNKIYLDQNQKRTPSDMWLRAVSDASKVGEEVRKGEPFQAMIQLAHTFGWIITTCDKLFKWDKYEEVQAIQSYDKIPQTSLTNITLSKYPTCCPYCEKNLCECSIRRKENAGTKKEISKMQQRIYSHTKYSTLKAVGHLPKNICELSEMFDNIYGQSLYEIPIERITFHFLEEIGEVAHCITSLHDNSHNYESIPFSVQLSEEIADVVAWGFAVVEKLSSLATDSQKLSSIFFTDEQNAKISIEYPTDHKLFSHWMWYTYTYGSGIPHCPTCGHEKCNC